MVTNSHQGNYSRVKKAVPAILFFFVFALIIDNSFKLISPAMATDLGVSATTISWQATLAGLIKVWVSSIIKSIIVALF